MKRKTTTTVRIKDADQGIVEAVVATLGVKDRDGDVAFKSSFTDGAPVVISAYQHGSWKGALPYGHGTLKVSDTEVVIEAQFLLNTTHGRDAFEVVKALGEQNLQEWSYSLHDVKQHRGEHNGEKVNFLDAIRVKEASPVLEGAGINTRVLATKGTKQLNSELAHGLDDAGSARWGGDGIWTYCVDFDVDEAYAIFAIYPDDGASRHVQVDFTTTDDGIELDTDEVEVERVTTYAPKAARARFSDHLVGVVRSVKAVTARATDVVALRAEKGKTISDEAREQLKQLDAELVALRAVIDEPTPEHTSDEDHEALQKALLVHVARTHGVTTS